MFKDHDYQLQKFEHMHLTTFMNLKPEYNTAGVFDSHSGGHLPILISLLLKQTQYLIQKDVDKLYNINTQACQLS